MTSFLRPATAVLSVLALGLLAGCGSDDSAAENTGSELYLASPESVMSVLPTQSQILEKQSFAYLMASPNISRVEVPKDVEEAHRKDKATGGDAARQQVNDKCAVYEQAAIGLVSTPSAQWTIADAARRNVIIGQSGIDQLNGYTSVLVTTDTNSAATLFNDFKSNSVACNDALKALYPSVADKFTMQSPAVDAGSGTVTLRGTYNGQPFNIAISQQDKYLFSTWFTTTGKGGEETISSATETIQGLTLDNVSHI